MNIRNTLLNFVQKNHNSSTLNFTFSYLCGSEINLIYNCITYEHIFLTKKENDKICQPRNIAALGLRFNTHLYEVFLKLKIYNLFLSSYQ